MTSGRLNDLKCYYFNQKVSFPTDTHRTEVASGSPVKPCPWPHFSPACSVLSPSVTAALSNPDGCLGFQKPGCAASLLSGPCPCAQALGVCRAQLSPSPELHVLPEVHPSRVFPMPSTPLLAVTWVPHNSRDTSSACVWQGSAQHHDLPGHPARQHRVQVTRALSIGPSRQARLLATLPREPSWQSVQKQQCQSARAWCAAVSTGLMSSGAWHVALCASARPGCGQRGTAWSRPP